MKKRCLIFCSIGLGDALLFLIVANNLEREGFLVTVYHDSLSEMQGWFPRFNIKRPLSLKEIKEDMKASDIIVINKDSTNINRELCLFSKREFFEKTWILKATTTKAKDRSSDFYLNKRNTMAENLQAFCKEAIFLKSPTSENGIKKRGNIEKKNRIVIHPTGKNFSHHWPKEKFLKLSIKLQKLGYQVSYIITKDEVEGWEDIKRHGIELPFFRSLDELSLYIAQSGYVIGNNSGIAHLSSSLKVPTFVIFSSKRQYLFWRPLLADGVYPPSYMPNIKGIRLRSRYWKRILGVSFVFRRVRRFLRYGKGCNI